MASGIEGSGKVLVPRALSPALPRRARLLRGGARHRARGDSRTRRTARSISTASRRALKEKTAAVILAQPNYFGLVEPSQRARRARSRSGRAPHRLRRSGLVRAPRPSGRVRRRYRGRRGAVARPSAELRRAAPRLHGDEDRVRAAHAGAPHQRNDRHRRKARLRDDAPDPRAAHPPREGDLEHLLERGALRPFGRGVSHRARRAGIPGGRRAELREEPRALLAARRGRRGARFPSASISSRSSFSSSRWAPPDS